MYFPDKKTFKELSREGLMVPVYKELEGTLGEPFEIFERLNPDKNSFLLESARFHPKIGRYSFLGFDPFMVFRSKDRCIEIIRRDGNTERLEGDPIVELRRLFDDLRSIRLDGLPNFTGGAVGYFGYDIRHFFENLPKIAEDDLKLPDINLLFVDTIVAFDHIKGSVKVISNAQGIKSPDKSYDEAVDKIERVILRLKGGINSNVQEFQNCRGDIYDARSSGSQLRRISLNTFCDALRDSEQGRGMNPTPTVSCHRRPNFPSIKSNFTEEGFRKIVKKAKEYIASGDIFQANLSQRFSVPCNLDSIGNYMLSKKGIREKDSFPLSAKWDIHAEGIGTLGKNHQGPPQFFGGVKPAKVLLDPLVLYKALRSINPSPFAAYLDLGDLQIVSSSPERLLKLEGRDVQTRPIAGTRPRGKTIEEDRRLSHELILNEKERAEHIMLVDLERNDLGRVCEYGTVLVDEFLVLEEYSHVFHIVSNVIGRMGQGKDCFDLLSAAFPGGTITGCPKVRCMEIIDELEPVTRNIYTGSIGYLGFNGDMDLNIVIRTLILTKGMGYLQVGAGIVADSDPAREYYETLYKAEALFKALEKVG